MPLALVQSQIDAFSAILLGIQVSRATATLPQNATQHLFTVTGSVCVKLMIGRVTVAIQSSDPVAKITGTPGAGTAVDIASTATLASLEIGGWIGVSGDGTALLANNHGASLLGAKPCFFLVDTGTIDLITTASKTGSIKWDLWYVPVDAGATITAA